MTVDSPPVFVAASLFFLLTTPILASDVITLRVGKWSDPRIG